MNKLIIKFQKSAVNRERSVLTLGFLSVSAYLLYAGYSVKLKKDIVTEWKYTFSPTVLNK